ncbi:MAG TPA: DUF4783 domain-containing protein [Bacteroidales bacterium]|jgi:hypothetical protein|nr:DUF4783 domain-containing protein [Bacteroidales bacterium]
MKKIISILFVLVMAIPASKTNASEMPAGILESVATAIRNGNSKELAKYFSSSVEISLPEKEGTFSKAQAEMVMKDFFTKNPPVSFAVNQQGSSSGGSQFMIGSYKSGSKVFRTYVLFKPVSGQLFIQQIEIETD